VDSPHRWGVPAPDPAPVRGLTGSSQHGSIIVQVAKNLRLENLEISGACNATGGNGAGLWVEPAGVGTVIRNCYFHDDDNGVLASKIPGARVVIMNSEFYWCGSPGPFQEGQNHNIYIGEVGEFIFMFNYSHASYRGQLVKARAGKNYILYNRLTAEKDTNYVVDLPYGGESYVIGNLMESSETGRNGTFMSYARETVMKILYKNGGPEVLKDKAELTDARTGQSFKLHYSMNYGAKGEWKNRDRAHFCTLSWDVTMANAPDLKPGDVLKYGKDSSIEVVEAEWSWTSPRREISVVNNTFVNQCALGYGQYLLRAHVDTKVADVRNNLIIDIKPPLRGKPHPYRLHPDATGGGKTKEKAVSEANNYWRKADPETADPGFVDLAKYDYRLTAKATDAIDKATPPGSVNGMSLAPIYQYVHPCRGEPRPSVGPLDIGAYEYKAGE
jgi:hypothetical protein